MTLHIAVGEDAVGEDRSALVENTECHTMKFAFPRCNPTNRENDPLYQSSVIWNATVLRNISCRAKACECQSLLNDQIIAVMSKNLPHQIRTAFMLIAHIHDTRSLKAYFPLESL